MKTELRGKYHEGENSVEIVHKGRTIGHILAVDGGIQVVSDHPMLPRHHSTGQIEIHIAMEREREVEFPPATPIIKEEDVPLPFPPPEKS